MTNAKRDQNYVTATLAISSSDSTATTPITVDPTTGRLLVDPSSSFLAPNIDYNYIDVQQTNATTETYVYKTGGAGGTTVLTIVVVYTSSTKADVDSVTWS